MTDLPSPSQFEQSFEIGLADVRDWAELLDDGNPLHEAAGGAVVPGPALLALVCSATRNLLPSSRVANMSCRFAMPVTAPAFVTVRLHVGDCTGVVSDRQSATAVLVVEGREVFQANLVLTEIDVTYGAP